MPEIEGTRVIASVVENTIRQIHRPPKDVIKNKKTVRLRRIKIQDISNSLFFNHLKPCATTTFHIILSNEKDVDKLMSYILVLDNYLRKQTSPFLLLDYQKTFIQTLGFKFTFEWYENSFFRKMQKILTDKEVSAILKSFDFQLNKVGIKHEFIVS